MRVVSGLFACAIVVLTGCGGSGAADAAVLVDTTPGVSPPVDASRPRGPVVVGPDLVPADYTCLGLRTTPPAGDAMQVVVAVRDWADGSLVPDARVQATTFFAPDAIDCTTVAGCAMGTTDASGHVTLSLAPGPVWLMTSDVATTWTGRLSIATGATTLTAPSVSLGIQQLFDTSGHSTSAVGTVRDCAGAAVHRAHVRAFTVAGGELPIGNGSNEAALFYANSRGNAMDDDRTTIDGVYVAQFFASGARIEVWGMREVGGPEVLLGCESLMLPDLRTTTIVDLGPLAADAPSDCGSVP